MHIVRGRGNKIEKKINKGTYSRVLNRCMAGNNCRAWKIVRRLNVGPLINAGHEQNVQIYVTKNPPNLKISVELGKNSKI